MFLEEKLKDNKIMPFFTPQPTPSNTQTVTDLNSAINNINSKIEYYEDPDPDKINFLEKIKKGKDKTEIQKCYKLLKDLIKNTNQINNKDIYIKTADAAEAFDSFCKIFPASLSERYFAPKFNKLYDILDSKFDELEGDKNQASDSEEVTGSEQVGTDSKKETDSYTNPSIVDYLNSTGQPSDFESRRKLAVQEKIVSKPEEYTGTAEQNTQLLQALSSKNQTPTPNSQIPAGPVAPIGVTGTGGETKPAEKKNPKALLGTDDRGNSLYFARIGPGNYRPAVQADSDAGVQLFARNPNPAARMVYPFIKVQNMPTRRTNI